MVQNLKNLIFTSEISTYYNNLGNITIGTTHMNLCAYFMQLNNHQKCRVWYSMDDNG
jgi:hypothetical protein